MGYMSIAKTAVNNGKHKSEKFYSNTQVSENAIVNIFLNMLFSFVELLVIMYFL